MEKSTHVTAGGKTYSVNTDGKRIIKTKKGDITLPCLDVIIVPRGMVVANNYNPNVVPKNKMQDLERSILSYGFCYAILTVWDVEMEKYVVVDGFHRDTVATIYLEAEEVPIIPLNLTIAERMAATVMFNRARGVHQVELMGDLVRALSEQGLDDPDISNSLGMELEEVYRLKQITGIAELFKNQTYSKSWIIVDTDEMEVD